MFFLFVFISSLERQTAGTVGSVAEEHGDMHINGGTGSSQLGVDPTRRDSIQRAHILFQTTVSAGSWSSAVTTVNASDLLTCATETETAGTALMRRTANLVSPFTLQSYYNHILSFIF